MIYFLVNNDYQLLDARRHAGDLDRAGMACRLLQVPHALNLPDRECGFEHSLTFPSPLTTHGWMAAWPRYFASAKAVAGNLAPLPGDVLCLYTEFELINHFIVHRFRRQGAKVFLIEDGGVGTYIPFSIGETEPLGAKEHLIAAMTRCLPGLSRTVFHKINGVVFPWVTDDHIDALLLYRPIASVRKIPSVLLRPERRPAIPVQPGKVVFLNEPIYDYYQTERQYLAGLERILDGLTRGFERVVFKFHPRETDAWIGKILALVDRFPAVEVFRKRQSIESLLSELRPEVLASYNSTTLLNLGGTGVEPLYLYHLFEDLAGQKVFRQMTALLSQWRYRFIPTLAEARTGYRSGLDAQGWEGGASLPEVLAKADLVTAG